MRKWRILTVLLAALAAAGLIAAAVWVHTGGSRVGYDETVLQGEAGAFEGVTVRTKALLGNNVFFETVYRPGTAQTPESRSWYGKSDWFSEEVPVFSVRSVLAPDTHCSAEETADAMVRDVASRAPADPEAYYAEQARTQDNRSSLTASEAGVTYTERVRARDYFETIPLEILFDEAYSDEKDADWQVYRLLQLPVPEDLTLLVSVHFYDYPDRTRYNRSIDAAEGGVPNLGVAFAKQAGGVYWFTLDCTLSDGGTLDTSRIPGGAGVFRFDTKANTAKTVFPLDAGTKTAALWLSEDEETLYLLHSLRGAHTLTALSVPDMAVRQSLALPFSAEAAMKAPYRQDGLLLIPADDGELLALTLGEDGLYKLEKQVDAAGDPALEQDARLEPWETITAALADGRLVLARQPMEEDASRDVDLILSVYDESGARHSMESRCSLRREIDPERNWRHYHFGNYPLLPSWQEPVRIEIGA